MLNITSKQEVLSNGIVVKRLYDEGGKLLSEHFHDSIGREVERKQYKDDGTLLCHNLYEYEGAGLKYQRLRSFDPTGKLVMEHESGKRPIIHE